MKKEKLKTILIDLDGVLNEYNGDFDENFIPEIRNGAKNFIKELSNNYVVKVFTTRNKILTVKWLIKYNLDKYVKDVTNVKEPALLHIDDRCINFCGNYDEVLEKVTNFSVWYN